jgi:hypothetical protein
VHHEYDLGKYEYTDSATAVDKSDALLGTKINAGDTISIDGEAAVDAVSAASGSFGNVGAEVVSLNSYVASNFDPATATLVHKAVNQ